MPTPEKTNQEQSPKDIRDLGKWNTESIDEYYDTMSATYHPRELLFCHGCGKSLMGIKHREKKWCIPCSKYAYVKRKYETK